MRQPTDRFTMATSHDLTTEDGMLAYLQQTRFPKCSNIQQLTGGTGGFTYRIDTNEPDRPTIVVKHAQGYAAKAPEWKLDPNRMVRPSTTEIPPVES